jgi:2,3-bisphosphoglycerate-dependent phosphoglycerate mutase
MNGKLFVTRHGESEWNAKGVWTGTTDIHLSEKGRGEAVQLGQTIKDAHINYAYTSLQVRSIETLAGMLTAGGQPNVPHEKTAAISERDYGIYTGKNKWQIKEEIGDDLFELIRRGWDTPIQGGETLKQVYERVVPFYLEKVLPRLRNGENVLLVAHGNSIRSLMKYIESVSDDLVSSVEMIFGETLVYTVDDSGRKISKEVRRIDTTPPAA